MHGMMVSIEIIEMSVNIINNDYKSNCSPMFRPKDETKILEKDDKKDINPLNSLININGLRLHLNIKR